LDLKRKETDLNELKETFKVFIQEFNSRKKPDCWIAALCYYFNIVINFRMK
jgi:hypothetical protein